MVDTVYRGGVDMKKILIVDDQSFIRTVFKQQLEQLGDVIAMEAANGNEAVGKAKVAHPDLILLDIVMPSKDGFAVLEDLRDDVELRDIPVIIVSSHAEEEKVAQAKRLGAREFINKMDINNIDFVGLVHRYIS
jgi:CheY-like chemotaxis protein